MPLFSLLRSYFWYDILKCCMPFPQCVADIEKSNRCAIFGTRVTVLPKDSEFLRDLIKMIDPASPLAGEIQRFDGRHNMPSGWAAITRVRLNLAEKTARKTIPTSGK